MATRNQWGLQAAELSLQGPLAGPRLSAEHYCMRKGPERFLFRPRQVCMVEGGSCGRGSQLMDCSLGQALQGNLVILTRIRPEDLDGPRRRV